MRDEEESAPLIPRYSALNIGSGGFRHERDFDPLPIFPGADTGEAVFLGETRRLPVGMGQLVGMMRVRAESDQSAAALGIERNGLRTGVGESEALVQSCCVD